MRDPKRKPEDLPRRTGPHTWFPRGWAPVVLKSTLTTLEREIRADLATGRTARSALRHEYLMRALAEVAAAREELDSYPTAKDASLSSALAMVKAASLALAVFEASVLRQGPEVLDAVRVYEGRQRGGAATRQQRQEKTADRHEEIRALAAAMADDLSASAKAVILGRRFGLSVRQIRRIIKK